MTKGACPDLLARFEAVVEQRVGHTVFEGLELGRHLGNYFGVQVVPDALKRRRVDVPFCADGNQQVLFLAGQPAFGDGLGHVDESEVSVGGAGDEISGVLVRQVPAVHGPPAWGRSGRATCVSPSNVIFAAVGCCVC